ncbi:MAG: ADP-ribose diphosphatase, partial [Rhodospirillaceae bacterium]|nr:ADP-ribose diphosphatase [Rhodospirillaceae bacterium]
MADMDRKVDVIERTTVFQGYYRVDAYRLRHSLHQGGMGAEIRREVLERGHAVL